MPEFTWTCKTFDQHGSRDELYEILLALGSLVVERQCIYRNVEQFVRQPTMSWPDPRMILPVMHDCFLNANTGPLLWVGWLQTGPVAAEAMARACRALRSKQCEGLWPGLGITISAQQYLEGFYQQLGFVTASSPYLEDDIAHIKMVRS